MKRRSLLFLLSIGFLTACGLSTVSAPSKALDALREEIQGKTPEEVYGTIVSFFGEPDRDVGSGLYIPQWDLEGGVLTFHPLTGPTFEDGEGNLFWLLVTENEAGENILGSYEMVTAPGLNGYGTQQWMGNLRLNPDGTYEFDDSGVDPGMGDYREENFLIHNPRGDFRIAYSPGIAGTTLLEGLADNAHLAVLELRAENADSASAAKFNIVIAGRSLRLNPEEYGKPPYYLYKAWDHFWNYNPDSGKDGDYQARPISQLPKPGIAWSPPTRVCGNRPFCGCFLRRDVRGARRVPENGPAGKENAPNRIRRAFRRVGSVGVHPKTMRTPVPAGQADESHTAGGFSQAG